MNNLKVICMTVFTALLFCFFNEAIAGTIKGTIGVKGIRNARNVVVYIDTMEGEFEPPKEHSAMDQKNMSFLPHILPILVGTAVDFLNNDSVRHNVYSPSKCAEKFNLGTWGKGGSRSYTFKNTGCRASILCNVHPEMLGWVVALQNPFFFKTGKDGVFIIENVPAGNYTLNVWHEKVKGPSQEVAVPQEGEIAVDFKMKRER